MRPPPVAPSPVVVTIVIDQFAAWVADERFDALPAGGGFARLRREGTYVREARQPYALTDTSSGHASLYTGAPPFLSGIYINELVDRRTGKHVSLLADPATRVVGRDGVEPRPSASLAALRVETLADRLRAEAPSSFIISLSRKDRGAIFGGGRRPDATLWYDATRGDYVTSTAFARALPAWVGGLAPPLARALQEPWSPLDINWLRAHAATPDDQPGEGDLGGLGVVFPHRVAAASDPSKAFQATPFADAAVFDAALAALAARPTDAGPTLIALSLSANDTIGHVFGPDSWEAWDNLARLDASLARLLSSLDAQFGPGGYAVLLSADHGTSSMPETNDVPGARPFCAPGHVDRWKRPCGPGERLFFEPLARELRDAAAKALGPGRWVVEVTDPYVVLSDESRALSPTRRDTLVAALTRALGRHSGVARVIDLRSRPARCPPLSDESVDALVCRSVPERADVDLYVVTKPGDSFDVGSDYVSGKGGNHGTPHLFDRAIPILARAPGRVRANAVVETPLPSATFVRTAAALLGISPPHDAIDARSLTE